MPIGQQRLTTLQLFLAAFRNAAAQSGFARYSDDIERHIFNSGLMDEDKKFEDWVIERFKVWPTKSDQLQFCRVVTCTSLEDLESLYPAVYERRRLKPRPRMVEAYLYFDRQLNAYLSDAELGQSVENRIAALHQALKSDLQVVSIELEDKDDAQVIFETLNARGQP